ncbi:cleavage stimulation factor subunit 2 tau variant-like [Tropilaelaps mercedesae]|uniref:Cleavage stimulation factor subunit 2 tau variant-like n=1 Tax=Tropilaelaps mercedesae TaxID=418985 RepID=A0A1V9XAP2_9ACAR|nr:cleavage stimulation factor subunit 2 tau variant-like [Tropilaelaps mercedesae]
MWEPREDQNQFIGLDWAELHVIADHRRYPNFENVFEIQQKTVLLFPIAKLALALSSRGPLRFVFLCQSIAPISFSATEQVDALGDSLTGRLCLPTLLLMMERRNPMRWRSERTVSDPSSQTSIELGACKMLLQKKPATAVATSVEEALIKASVSLPVVASISQFIHFFIQGCKGHNILQTPPLADECGHRTQRLEWYKEASLCCYRLSVIHRCMHLLLTAAVVDPGSDTCPGVQSPVVQSHGVQSPVVQSPGVQSPVVQSRGVQSRGVQRRGVQIPGVQIPGVQSRSVQISEVQSHGVQSHGVQSPVVQSPVVQSRGVQSRGVQRRGVQNRGVQRCRVQSRGVQRRRVQSRGSSAVGTQSYAPSFRSRSGQQKEKSAMTITTRRKKWTKNTKNRGLLSAATQSLCGALDGLSSSATRAIRPGLRHSARGSSAPTQFRRPNPSGCGASKRRRPEISVLDSDGGDIITPLISCYDVTLVRRLAVLLCSDAPNTHPSPCAATSPTNNNEVHRQKINDDPPT